MFHIKLTGVRQRTQYKHIFYPFLHHDPRMGSKGQTFFLKKVMLHIKLKGKKCRTLCEKIFDIMHTIDLLGWVKRSDIEIMLIRIF